MGTGESWEMRGRGSQSQTGLSALHLHLPMLVALLTDTGLTLLLSKETLPHAEFGEFPGGYFLEGH